MSRCIISVMVDSSLEQIEGSRRVCDALLRFKQVLFLRFLER